MKRNGSLALFLILLLSNILLISTSTYKHHSSNSKSFLKSQVKNKSKYSSNHKHYFNKSNLMLNIINEIRNQKTQKRKHYGLNRMKREDIKTNQVVGWMSVTSITLANPDYFPDLSTPNGTQRVYYDKNFTRLNPLFKPGDNTIPYPTAFYFKLNDNYLFYYASKTDDHILGSMNINSIKQAALQIKNTSCFNIVDFSENKWIFCNEGDAEALKFICKIQKALGLEMERNCGANQAVINAPKPKVEIQKVKQPLIIIPLPSKFCNANWDYSKNGDNWECECKTGKEQSPINLPTTIDSVDSAFKPNFEYLIVDKQIIIDDSQIGIYKGDVLKVRIEGGLLKILHPNMGRVVTPDGSVYQAKEIQFHSPSEHLIEGKRLDLEMEVVHYGITKGDIYKKLVLSILFVSSPGSLNKFFDKINVYDLPNPIDRYREIPDSIFIPYVFFKSEDDDMNIMKPFSFYTYQGSMTTPPCEETVIHYVTSSPIPLSNTSITLMKEALRVPDMIDTKGNLKIDNNVYENYRNDQPLNGRAVFHYDFNKYECPELTNKLNKKNKETKSGHYEKITKNAEKYFYVPGFEPSGLPNSILVTEEEANNK